MVVTNYHGSDRKYELGIIRRDEFDAFHVKRNFPRVSIAAARDFVYSVWNSS